MARAPMESALADKRVVVTRAPHQAGELVALLLERGAIPVEVPTIEITTPSDDGAALAEACGRLVEGAYGWVVLTSTNGARALLEAARAHEAALVESQVSGSWAERLLRTGTSVAAIGSATAKVLSEAGLEPSFVPSRHVGEAFVEEFIRAHPDPGGVLVAQAEVARPVIVDGLAEAGWAVSQVSAYRSVDATVTPEQRELARHADAITFASASTFERYVRLVGAPLPKVVAAIGPITAAAVTQAGCSVDVVAEPHTVAGLVGCLERHFSSG